MFSISKQDVETIKHWFSGYVKGFKSGSDAMTENTVLKECHSLRVCDEILSIGRSLRLSPAALNLAEISALLHDVGRFEQYRRYGTFVDARSVNHAGLGVEIVQSHNVLDQLDMVAKDLILKAIACHNRACLPADGDAAFLFFARLLRDADKLDIFRIVTDYYADTGAHRNTAIELDLPDTEGYSDAVLASLMAGEVVNIRNLENFNDFKLLQVGWIFDINFAASFSAVQSRGYLEKIENALPVDNHLKSMFDMARAHLRARIQEGNAGHCIPALDALFMA